ncbi:U4/U6 x U5 tri-snRNP complex protein [Malassezia pachydermatis]
MAAEEHGITLDELGTYDRTLTIDAQGPAPMSSGDAALHAMLEQRKLAAKVPVPTSDVQVRERLRHYGEPVTLFGEREPDRRARLLQVLIARHGKHAVNLSHAPTQGAQDDQDDDDEEEFYTEGSDDLLLARRHIAAFSLSRAKARTAQQRWEAQVPLQDVAAMRKAVLEPLKTYQSLGAQVAGSRPISMVRYSPDSSMLATGSWSGAAALWSMPNAKAIRTLHGMYTCRDLLAAHEDRVAGLAWHPQATLSQSKESVNLATGAGDGLICTWSLGSEQPLQRLQGHEARVCRIAFHPMGRYLASASFDGTWRMWDVERGTELLLQEGHSREVYAVDFQNDGALLASGYVFGLWLTCSGLDAIGRVWDTRTGRTAMVLDGHAREILSMAFAPNGYQVLSASGDDTVRVWDLRTLSSLYTIPAHRSSVADVRFFQAADERPRRPVPWWQEDAQEDVSMDVDVQPTSTPTPTLRRSGTYFATAGYDGYVKLWSADDWQLVKSLSGDAGKVMSVDISADGQYLASGEWARTFKLWGAL